MSPPSNSNSSRPLPFYKTFFCSAIAACTAEVSELNAMNHSQHADPRIACAGDHAAIGYGQSHPAASEGQHQIQWSAGHDDDHRKGGGTRSTVEGD
jgi:hypothetical protein